MSGKCFSLFGSLWSWPLTYWPKIKRVLQLNKGYHPMKVEGSGSKGTQVNERKRFSLFRSVTLTFDLLTPKSTGVFYSIRAIILWSLKALGQRVLELLSGNGFHSSGHCDLDLWPTDPKINRGLLLNKGYHPMKFEGSGSKGTRVIERKRSVTDGQTDKAKTICLPQRGGYIIKCTVTEPMFNVNLEMLKATSAYKTCCLFM